MPDLHIMVGIPGSGKDYYIDHNCVRQDSDVVISSDAIRAELGDVNDQSQNEEVFKILYNRLGRHLQRGDNIWFNATNVTISNRSRAIEMGKKFGYRIIADIMATPFGVCVRRDSQRDRTVGEEVIKKFVFRFQIPFYEEGFDTIHIIGTNAPLDPGEIKRLMEGTEQFSKWHQENVLFHSILVSALFDCDDLQPYVFYHDIGKIWTQTKSEDRYHFYGHENVGTYYLLTHPIDGHPDLNGLFLVNYHMLLHQELSDKTIRKYRQLFGEAKYSLLERFVAADNRGCVRLRE